MGGTRNIKFTTSRNIFRGIRSPAPTRLDTIVTVDLRAGGLGATKFEAYGGKNGIDIQGGDIGATGVTGALGLLDYLDGRIVCATMGKGILSRG